MLQIDVGDEELNALRGAEVIPSTNQTVRYRLERKLGSGGMSVVYEARRTSAKGESLAVVKMMHPAFVFNAQQKAITAMTKEAAALGKLNEQAPPTPFVVRFYDYGFLEVSFGLKHLHLPWLALEHIQGGAMGTTLHERVAHSMAAAGHAFEMSRAVRAIESICQGMTAVHEVGIIHRDLKPDNVLCCGSGDDELFKISDFGVSRAPDVKATFMEIAVGTPGYAPLEQFLADKGNLGPRTDVFAIAATTFFLLTGENLFPSATLADALKDMASTERRSVLSAPGLDPELRASPWRCKQLDDIIARATASDVRNRPSSAQELSALLVSCLRTDTTRPRAHRKLLHSLSGARLAEYTWTVRNAPGHDFIVRSVAWNSDGSALAVTSRGLAFWNGTAWRDIPLGNHPDPTGLRFVRQIGPNQWLLGGEGASLASFSSQGIDQSIQGQDPGMVIEYASGDITDLAVVSATAAGYPPLLFPIAARRWMRAMPLDDFALVNSIERVADASWLVAGRSSDGQGVVGLYEPLQWQFTPLRVPRTRAYLAGVGIPALGLGLVVGTDGAIVQYEDGQISSEVLDGHPQLASVALDPTRIAWACSAGQIWCRKLGGDTRWRSAWQDPSWKSPLVSLQADLGVVRAMSADGGILEGMSPRSAALAAM